METNIWNFGKDRASKEWWRRSVEEKVRGEEAIYSTIRTRWDNPENLNIREHLVRFSN